ncbi:MAG: hypothetical protein LAT82_05450 [Nanoarchaeota archaeon]|nr:hypothetical protein [Nanoarchaeota archaeon]
MSFHKHSSKILLLIIFSITIVIMALQLDNNSNLWDENVKLKKELTYYQSKIEILENQITYISNLSNQLESQLESQLINYEKLKCEFESKLIALEKELNITYSELSKFNNSVSKSISSSQVLNFLREDTTDKIQRAEDFVCIHYSSRLVRNSLDKGLFSCQGVINFIVDNNELMRSGHSFVVFNTTDLGLIFVEPSNDRVFLDLQIGDNYCNKVGWNCNWKITQLAHCFDEI